MNNRRIVFLCWLVTCVAATTSLLGQTNAPAFRWARSAGGTNREFATDVAVDPAGISHVIGKIHGNSATFGSISVTNEGVFVATYDSEGNALWVNVITLSPQGNNQSWFNIATDDSGNTYVGGHFIILTMGFGTTNLAPSNPDSYDIFLAKYDPSGHLAWARTSRSSVSAGVRAFGLACDATGNCYLTGDYSSADGLGLPDPGPRGLYVAKFDAAGNLVWARQTALVTDPFNPHTYPKAVALGPSGDYYLAGEFAVTNINLGGTVLTNNGIYADIFVARYNSAGNLLWARSGGGPAYDSIWGISVDSAGSCCVGAWNQSPQPLNFSGCTMTNQGIVKFDPNGNVLWCRQIIYTGNYRNFRHAVDTSGSVYFAGLFEGVATMGGLLFTNRGSDGTHIGDYPSCFLLKLNSEGQAVSVKQFGGGDFAFPDPTDVMDLQGGVGLNKAGDCTVVGCLSITNGVFDSFTLSSAGDEDIFVARFEAEPPGLHIRAPLGPIIISWPTNQSAFGLERASQISSGSIWESVTNAPVVVGMENQVTQSASTNSLFFRLRKNQ